MAKPSSAGYRSEEIAEKFQNRTLQEAYDECHREMQLRLRCFDRWVAEGRLTASDATDRLQRLAKAVWMLGEIIDADHGSKVIDLFSTETTKAVEAEEDKPPF